ncbi:MAG: hypothetical protein ABI980_13765 [Nitrospirota bacterium]
MSKWAGPEFGLLQIGSWLIVIVVWLAIVFFAWKFFMENPMAKTGRDRKKLDSENRSSLPPDSNQQ